MNIDIQNYGHYRVTNHGGRSYQLFNRETDQVLDIARHDWKFINEVGLDACILIEKEKTDGDRQL